MYNYNKNPQDKGETKTTNASRNEAIREEEEPQEAVRKPAQTKSPVKQMTTSPSKSNVRGTIVANKAAMFESSPTKPSVKDPALLSVSERKALFEKNMGAALTPKAPFGMAVPLKKDPVKTTKNEPAQSAVKNEPAKAIVKNESAKYVVVKNESAKPAVVEKPAVRKYPAPKPPVASPSSGESQVSYKTGGIASKMAALLENKATIAQEQIESNIKEQRQKEIDLLLNRFDRNKKVCEFSLVLDTCLYLGNGN